MLLGIDHIVIAVRDPDAAADLLTAEVGLAAGGAGRHPHLGTFNRLIWLGDAYLELMGVADRDQARLSGIGSASLALLERGEEGVASFAIATNSLAGDLAILQAQGAPFGPATAGERERPDGEVVRWATSVPDRVGPEGLPFLIEHRYQGAEWGADALDERAAFVHPFGGRAVLARLELGVSNPAAAAARHRAALGLEVLSEEDGTIDLPIGPTLLRLVRRRPGVPHASIVVAGTAGQPRSIEILGGRFLVEVATIGSERD